MARHSSKPKPRQSLRSLKRAVEAQNYGGQSPSGSRVDQWVHEYDKQPKYEDPNSQPTVESPENSARMASETQSTTGYGDGSETADTKRTARSVSGSPNYISELSDHGIEIDFIGEMIPAPLHEFLENKILNMEGQVPLTDTEWGVILQLRVTLARANETGVSGIFQSSLFPGPLPRQLLSEGETIWNKSALPCGYQPVCTLIQPKSDYFFAYNDNFHGPIQGPEKQILNYSLCQPHARPAKKLLFPYLIVEMKSDPAAGSLYKAEMQAAAAGAGCVNGMRWFLDASNESEVLNKVESTIAFSVVMNHRLLALYVHWYSSRANAPPQYIMSLVDEFLVLKREHCERFAQAISNIQKWAVGSRREQLLSTLGKLLHIHPEWMRPLLKRSAASDTNANKRKKTDLPPVPPFEPLAVSSDADADGTGSAKSAKDQVIPNASGPPSPAITPEAGSSLNGSQPSTRKGRARKASTAKSSVRKTPSLDTTASQPPLSRGSAPGEADLRDVAPQSPDLEYPASQHSGIPQASELREAFDSQETKI